ncbi:MAG: 3-dehydroquinate synthase [Alphaproteobacteria bacterium]|nr:3-dehydroquinate synthase [Alphaproteobacteria bacterium]
MTIDTLHLDLGSRSYYVRIGLGLIDNAAREISDLLVRPKVVIITDETVAALHLDRLTAALTRDNIEVSSLSLPAGEATKNWRALEQTVEWLLAEKVERDDLVIAFGGGVIGDLTGFCAAILRRGVRFVQIPTTLLAQVDSSVGGKTGINSPKGKNLIGAFYQPARVLADIGVLDTLTPRDFIAGYGEVVKYGLLGSAAFFEWLETNGPALAAGDIDKRAYAVRRSCEMKAEIVARDEKEHGERALLNLGHTFGHALEAATGYSSRLLHGEGVAIGSVLAFDLSQALGLCSQECPSRVRAHLRQMNMKTELSDIKGELPDAEGLLALMGQDKKVQAGKPRFILAREIGSSFMAEDVDETAVKTVLKQALDRR